MKAARSTSPIIACLLLGWLLSASGCGRQNEPSTQHRPPPVPVTAPKAQHHSRSPGYTNWWLAWSKELIEGGYQQAGRKDPKWDEPVVKALEDYAYRRVFRAPPAGNAPDLFQNLLKQALAAGCDDALIVYLHTRRFNRAPASANAATAAEYSRSAAALEATSYRPILKFFANLRAAQAWRAAFAKQAPEVNQFRRAAMSHLQSVLQAEEIPAGAAFEACQELYETIEQNPAQRRDFYFGAEPCLFARWPDEGFPYYLKGKFYLAYAWEARGGGWASTVTDEGWKTFGERLKIAEQGLEKAWQLDPSLPETPVAFLRLELGQGRARERMEKWYERALAWPENHYEAVRWKLWYLEPRWHGSEQECLETARAAVRSDRFRGRVPLLLYHTHESLATYFKDQRPGYWLEPHVWPDLKEAFTRYFDLNGDDTDWRHNYVMCAWRCQQWKTLTEEIPKLKWVNHEYFGGREAFEQMKEKAQAMVGKAQ
ncbi:MAG: hypothetical protein HYY24_28600 [Verrucomicrobia bacterium]|nr:hypothetical protein [Verrucomicrobiota bacterium]